MSAYIGIGSNLGDKRSYCLRAIKMMQQLKDTEVMTTSRFYKTEPVDVEDEQDWYLNAVVVLKTALKPRELMAGLLIIERELGRQRKKRWDSRTIDLDILLFGDLVINEKDLKVPHPRLHLRRFVLVPLAELAPDLVHPILNETIADLLDKCPQEGQGVVVLES
ncbi:MAG: 2-amino-4-hydroxy-6-hydroxymethyldihydropteridine diphosphokinase [Deltaproteobacteria bacterium]|nr:MAG: 2-amino-4-hydroxy-6-hydroxymethyldihydropteridine diphosphokinase [Deltaproteobacteria bacterium]